LNRKGHLLGATSAWTVTIVLYYFFSGIDFASIDVKHSVWMILSFFACHFGAQLPDYDVLWKKILPHRNVITHSFILPILFTLPVYLTRTDLIGDFVFLVPIFAMYLVGHASHLFLDLMPESWEGTALIHIFWRNENGRKTMPKASSFLFLLINGLIILAGGIILLFFFSRWVT
jgi:hypothetical protein